MAGTRLLSYFQIGKETTKGSAVAATKMFHPDLSGAFSVDWGYNLHEGRYNLARTNVDYATRTMERVDITYRTPDDVGVGFDELPYFFIFPGGGTAGTGSTAWTWTHSWGGTTAGSAVSYTIEFGDDVQNYEAEYCQATRLRLSGGSDGKTQLEADFVGRQATKSSKTALTASQAVRIPSYLWALKHATAFSGLAAATSIPNFLREWEIDWTTGLTPAFYADGNDYFGQMNESVPVRGNIRLVVDSNATAITQYYDKGAAATVDFLRLQAYGSTLGATAYAAIMEAAVIYTNVTPLGSEIDGVNTYEVEAELVYDATGAKAMGATVVCATASL